MKKTAKKHAKPGTAVAVHKAAPPPAPASFIEFLSQASRDPSFNVEKFKVIIEAKEREDARQAERAFDAAMAACQAAIEPIRADLINPQTSSKYLSDIALDKALRPIYSKHGIALSYGTAESNLPDHVRVTCRVSCAGHSRLEHIDIPVVTIGPKGNAVMTKTHATMSAATVGRRTLETLIFNLKVIKPKVKKNGDSFVEVTDLLADDDGNAAGGLVDSGSISETQAHEISLLMTETKSKTDLFLGMLSEIGRIKINAVPNIPASLYQTAIEKLRLKKERMTRPVT